MQNFSVLEDRQCTYNVTTRSCKYCWCGKARSNTQP